ncbi:MAG TPA: hypothetical protein VFC28_00960, partial [Opitutaceae bacterium]|nr:hypothetical protein [Opitutaceae bacterium]
MVKRTLGMVAAVILVLGAIAAFKVYTIEKINRARAAARPPPVAVATINAATSTWQREFHAVGTLTAAEGVTVSNELA